MVGLAQHHLPRIRALGATEEVSRALTWIGEGYMHVGRYDDARSTLAEALENGRVLGDDSCIGYASAELMWLDTIVAEGPDFDSLPDRATELEALAGRVGDRYLATLAHYARWAHATQIGKIGAALEIARHMRAHGEQSNYPPAVCWGACLEGDGHAKAGNAIEAEKAGLAGREAAACRDSTGDNPKSNNCIQVCRTMKNPTNPNASAPKYWRYNGKTMMPMIVV